MLVDDLEAAVVALDAATAVGLSLAWCTTAGTVAKSKGVGEIIGHGLAIDALDNIARVKACLRGETIARNRIDMDRRIGRGAERDAGTALAGRRVLPRRDGRGDDLTRSVERDLSLIHISEPTRPY